MVGYSLPQVARVVHRNPHVVRVMATSAGLAEYVNTGTGFPAQFPESVALTIVTFVVSGARPKRLRRYADPLVKTITAEVEWVLMTPARSYVVTDEDRLDVAVREAMYDGLTTVVHLKPLTRALHAA